MEMFKAKKKPQMQLKQTLHNTKNFLYKTFQNLKSLVIGGYQKLPKIPFGNPFLSSMKKTNQKMHELDEFFKGFSDHWKSNLEELNNSKNEALASAEVQSLEDGQESDLGRTGRQGGQGDKMEKKQQEQKRDDSSCDHNANRGGNNLAQKLKEFEMLEVDDVDHVLDIEEVLHYYSRLTSPIYVEMVDKFFMDMYSEFSIPQPSVSCNSSMRRLKPLKL